MGAGPSSRCGHTLTTSRDKIVVLGGESAISVAGKDESTVAFVLDTARIRFPTDNNSTARPSSSKGPRNVRELTSPIPASYSSRPSSRGDGTGGTDSPRVFAQEPPRSRGGDINRIRSPSPVKGGSLPSRGSLENRGGHKRSNSGSGSDIQQSSSLRTDRKSTRLNS